MSALRSTGRVRWVAVVTVAVLTALVVPVAPAASDDYVAIAWERTFEGESEFIDQTVLDLAVDGDGAVTVAGVTFGDVAGESGFGIEDAVVRRYDSDGVVVWTTQLGGPDDDAATGIAAAADGGVYVAGALNWREPDAVGFLTRLDDQGDELWSVDPAVRPTGAASDGAGGVYVVGDGLLGELLVVRIDATGAPLWSAPLPAPAGARSGGATVDDAGNVYVSGTTPPGLPGVPGLGGDDGFVVKLDASGAPAWTASLGGAGSDRGTDVAYGGGALHAVGEAGDVPSVWRLDPADGSLLWHRSVLVGDGPGQRLFAVASDAVGSAYVVGRAVDTDGCISTFTHKLDVAGDVAWTLPGTTVGCLGDDHDDLGAVGIGAAGHLYVGGMKNGSWLLYVAQLTQDDPGIVIVGFESESVGVVEGDRGTSQLRVAVRLSAPADATITVPVSFHAGTATAGVDYKANDTVVRIRRGTTVGYASVQIRGDQHPEGDETFTAHLGLPTGPARLGSATTTLVTIIDDDDAASG